MWCVQRTYTEIETSTTRVVSWGSLSFAWRPFTALRFITLLDWYSLCDCTFICCVGKNCKFILTKIGRIIRQKCSKTQLTYGHLQFKTFQGRYPKNSVCVVDDNLIRDEKGWGPITMFSLGPPRTLIRPWMEKNHTLNQSLTHSLSQLIWCAGNQSFCFGNDG